MNGDDEGEQLGMCGAVKEMPPELIELERRVTGLDWTGVTVTCFEEPHGDEYGHTGLLDRDGEVSGVYQWPL